MTFRSFGCRDVELAPLQKIPQRTSGDISKEPSLAPRRPVEYSIPEPFWRGIGPRTCHGEGGRAKALKTDLIKGACLFPASLPRSGVGWLQLIPVPPCILGWRAPRGNLGILINSFNPVRGLTEYRTLNYWTPTAGSSDPPSRRSSVSPWG